MGIDPYLTLIFLKNKKLCRFSHGTPSHTITTKVLVILLLQYHFDIIVIKWLNGSGMVISH